MRCTSVAFALVMCGACRLGFELPGAAQDASALDSRALGDSGATIDSADSLALPCPPADGQTLALYTFDTDVGASIIDSTGVHDGTTVDGSTPPAYRSGPPGCGQALSIASGNEITAQVPHSDAWNLAEGSVDLWVWPAGDGVIPDYAGIVSRDANGTDEGGHFAIYQWAFAAPDRFAVRIQGMNDPQGTYLCSDDEILYDRWNHIGVNFGPPQAELWINGVLATVQDQIADDQNRIYDCNQATARGIEGNTNPWSFGIDTGISGNGELRPLQNPLIDGAIDHVRISSERRDFRMLSTALRP